MFTPCKGTVPVLVTPDGQIIDQSLDIMLWALRQHDPEGWLQPETAPLAEALALIARCDGDFKDQLDRYKYPSCMGISDAGIMPFIRQFSHTDAAWFGAQPWPHLQAWLTRFEASRPFLQVMQPYAAWQAGTQGVGFPETGV